MVILLSSSSRVVLCLPKSSNGQELILSPKSLSSFQSKTRSDFPTVESTLTKHLLLTQDSSTPQNTLRVSQNLKRIEVKITCLFTLLITKRDFKETTIMVGITTTEIWFAIHPSSHTRAKVLISTPSIMSTILDKINYKVDQQKMLRSNSGLQTKKSSNSHMPMKLHLKNAEREELMFTLDGKWCLLSKTNTVKRLLHSDA